MAYSKVINFLSKKEISSLQDTSMSSLSSYSQELCATLIKNKNSSKTFRLLCLPVGHTDQAKDKTCLDSNSSENDFATTKVFIFLQRSEIFIPEAAEPAEMMFVACHCRDNERPASWLLTFYL